MNLNTSQLLENAVRAGASDVFIVAGLPVSMRINGVIAREDECRLLPEDTRMVIGQIYQLAGNRPISNLEDSGDDDFSFAIPGLSRFRVSAYKQRGALSVVIRIITFTLPDPKEIGLPDKIINFAHYSKGMVLVTGPAGSGKSTTLACIIDHINKSYDKHIITLEDPLEYLHRHNKSIVSQREINVDTQSYVTALRASLRQSPDVILLGEMRDYETISAALLAAETGHLVLSTLHTTGAAPTVERIIDACPTGSQNQIRIQLAAALKGIVSQCLIPCGEVKGAARIAGTELLVATDAILNLIREGKTHQISGNAGMHTLNMDLSRLMRQGYITKERAREYTNNPAELEQYMM